MQGVTHDDDNTSDKYITTELRNTNLNGKH